jgi:Ca-activated chloride channel family protein
MPAKIHVERMMHRNSISVRGDSAASYALVKLIPTGDGPSKPLSLNLALVLDVSGSMYEEDGTSISRLKRIQQAAQRAIGKLRPEDNLAIVAFAHNAQVVLPSTSVSEKGKIEEMIQRIDMFDVDPGGTAMDEGMKLGLGELTNQSANGRIQQMVVLTDGETAGEQNCRNLAQQMGNDKIHLTLMGVGSEWNAGLIKDLARLNGSDGKWYYVDVEKAEEAERVFLQEFEHLAAATFTNVALHVRPVKDVRLKRTRMVVPEIKEMAGREVEDRHLVVDLGTLERDKPMRYVLDLSLPARPDGNYVIAQLEVTYDVAGQHETTGPLPLQIAYNAASPGYVNAEVAKHIDEVQIFELNNNLQQAIATNDVQEIKRTAEAIEAKGNILGPRAAKKTMLARQALLEINAGGRVSKKTQLALADSARLAEEMPIP